MSILGIVLILGTCVLLSKNRKLISLRVVLTGLILQALFAFIILKTEIGRIVFLKVGLGVEALIKFADVGGEFAFGSLYSSLGFVFAFKIISAIIFICALFAMLNYIGFLHPILNFFSRILQKIMGVSGPEVLAAVSSALIGQVESALPLKPYFSKLSNNQFFTIMVGGMSTMSIALLAVYASLGIPIHYLLAANLMGIPAGLVIAKILYPSTKEESLQVLPVPEKEEAHNIMDSIVRGAQDGFKISMAIITVVIAILSIIALINQLFGLGHISFAQFLSWIFYPLAVIIGTPLESVEFVSTLIGQKIALNEFIAYINLAEYIQICPSLSDRLIMISTFVICGFANFGSVAIQLGAFTEMMPERRQDFASMGVMAMFAGAIASCLSACWANLLF